MLRSIAFVACFWSLLPNGLAGAGEVYISARLAGEAGNLTYSRGGIEAMPGSGLPWLLMPRFGAEAQYGLDDAWHLGIAFDMALSPTTRSSNLIIDSRIGDLHAGYFEASFGGSLSYRLYGDWDFGGVFTAHVGVSIVDWNETDFTAIIPDGSGNNPPLAVTLEHPTYGAFFASFAAELEWRFSEWMAVSAGPYIQFRQSAGFEGAGTNVYLGFALRPSVVLWGNSDDES